MEVNSPRDRLSSGASQLNSTHPRPHTHARIHAPKYGRRSHCSHWFLTYHCGFSCGPFPGTGRSHDVGWAPVAIALSEMVFRRIHGELARRRSRSTSSPAQSLKEGQEWERGWKLVSGMDSLKWIVLGDIALTFVQSAVLRDLPVCFNSAALAKFSWAAWNLG